MIFLPLFSALAMLAFGLSALRLNAKRRVNQVLALVCFVSAIMFTIQLIARYEGARYAVDLVSNPMPWVRLRFACIGFLCPLMVWTCYYVVSGRFTTRINLAVKLAPWAAISLFLIVIPFTESFKSSASRPDRILDGPLYTVYFILMLVCELAVCIASIVTASRLGGIRGLEFRFITIAFGYLSLTAIVMALLHSLFRTTWLLGTVQMLSFLVFLVFGISAWSVTSRRIYHGSQVLLPIAERLGVAAAVAVPTVYAVRWARHFEASSWPAAVLIGFACAGFYYLDDKLRGFLSLKWEQRANAITKELQRTASAEFDLSNLVAKLESVLSRNVAGVKVSILTPETDHFERGSLVLAREVLLKTSLLKDGWVSTASLARTSGTEETEALRHRLEREHIHVLASPRWNETEPGAIVAFGERENGVPFTFPEIQMLRVLAEVTDGLYTRSRFSLQARQGEQLATIGLVGAGLAHELRNPMAAIDTFAQLLPARLHDEEFLREFAQIVPGEARRIQALAEQLLDLARPRRYEFAPINLHDVIAESLSLVRPKAEASNVELHFHRSAAHPEIVADPRSLRQIFLNLLLNSIQSLVQSGRAGHVAVRTADAHRRIVAETEDDGPGIPETVRSRLFTPLTSVGKTGGLGLGLAICAEIARIHHGEISAEAHEGGALFRITLPIAGPNG